MLKLKTTLFIGLTAVLLAFSGCTKISELTQFEMPIDTSVEIESSTGINLPFNVYSPDVESNSESTFAVNDTRKDLIELIILKSLSLDITSPSNSDFSFLESIEVFISTDDLPEIRIAYKTDIPSNVGDELILETVGADLKEYIKSDDFQLRLNTVTDEIITSDHQIDIHSVFFVDATVLGF